MQIFYGSALVHLDKNNGYTITCIDSMYLYAWGLARRLIFTLDCETGTILDAIIWPGMVIPCNMDRRLFRRYLDTNPAFIWMLIRDWIRVTFSSVLIFVVICEWTVPEMNLNKT